MANSPDGLQGGHLTDYKQDNVDEAIARHQRNRDNLWEHGRSIHDQIQTVEF